MKLLNGMGIVVTGGETPFGILLAQSLVEEGANVLLSCFNRQTQPNFAGAASRQRSPALMWVSGDPRDPEYCRAIIEYADHHFGRLDGLINNADYEFQTVWPVEAPLFHPHLASQAPVDVVKNFTQAAADIMQPGGAIIHTLAADPPGPRIHFPAIFTSGRQGSSTEKALLLQDIRVMVIRPEPGGLLDPTVQWSTSLPKQNLGKVDRLTQNYIAFLADN